MEDLVRELCRCDGRRPGSAGSRRARAAILSALGGHEVLEQPTGVGTNLVVRIPGSAPDGRAILVGAHYDHLGPGFPGADDNAAAVGIAVEVAHALRRQPARRDVLVVAFDGEEPPYFLSEHMGSEVFAQAAPPLDLVITLDLVGHALGEPELPAEVRDTQFVFGAELSDGTRELVDGVAAPPGVVPRRAGLNLLPPLSDYHPFQEREVPVLFVTGGRWRHYHQPTDTADRLDYRKMAATAAWLGELIRAAGEQTGRRFHPHARDDASTIRTVRALAEHISPELVRRADALPMDRRLTPSDFLELRTLVAIVEGMLA